MKTVIELDNSMWFPDVRYAYSDGLLAMGGDLTAERLLLAYRSGIFPWYNEMTPILWYAPPKRFVLFPKELRISKSMRSLIRSRRFLITKNRDFDRVISLCANITRKDQDGTWITKEMKKAYIDLYKKQEAMSVEVWENGELVGGLYGVKVGKVFCGESMFHTVSNASKMAIVYLCQSSDFEMIDCQIYSEHLDSLGARTISMTSYLNYLSHTG